MTDYQGPERRLNSITLHRDELDALIERASERGAKKALQSIGLGDDKAASDITLMRRFVRTVDGITNTATKTITVLVLTALFGLLALGFWVKTGQLPMGKSS